MFALIKPALIRYPAIDAATFRNALTEFCDGELPGEALVKKGLPIFKRIAARSRPTWSRSRARA
ncbi:MAG: hypothetical protein H0X04_02075 [Chthoniobacterales bacterium]|nr:hypothetical protein [Chthoniobacterales bacterium]